MVGVVGFVGSACGTVPPDDEAVVTEVPADCSDAWKPVEQSIQAFAGEAYDASTEFETGSRGADYGSQELNCAKKFGASIPREPVENHRTPMWRRVSISYSEARHHTTAGATTSSLQTSPGTIPTVTPSPGIGGDATISIVDAPEGEARKVRVKFRTGRLMVTVETSGKDWSGVPETPPVTDSPELRADLRTGAESIAKAVARQPLSAVTLTGSSSTGTPTTTQVATPVWDPCQISQQNLTAAGLLLDSGSSFRQRTPGSATCRWHGDGYELSAYSDDSTFESSIYNSPEYARPKPVVIGDRYALQVHQDDLEEYCNLAFELREKVDRSDYGGRTLRFQIWQEEGRSRTELCDELIRTVGILASSLPPTI
ncbi:uncharacterized protein DUF3558 [Nocardia mexicana]|uniref:Uncharacterized protein DUF3558 n=2 Tax=Nocardia mexicana TaxID=279262 RepID=A0A370HCY0_9NOCA|nr:uncharacterized protein DUF3558 [Nocardia mexicana]